MILKKNKNKLSLRAINLDRVELVEVMNSKEWGSYRLLPLDLIDLFKLNRTRQGWPKAYAVQNNIMYFDFTSKQQINLRIIYSEIKEY